ncbi:MAG TPA: primase alpha helix C-terminal domain-containing protein, partial [Chloroflexia bacterium]|nr:primase alpha helix C-terminal domain-containing protein [Chloroflexia bacterium]
FPPPPPRSTCSVRAGPEGDGAVPPGLLRFARAGQPAGGRNNGGFWLACRLVEQVGDAAAGRRMLDDYGAACRPPLTAAELDRIWASAGRTTSYGAPPRAPPVPRAGRGPQHPAVRRTPRAPACGPRGPAL